MARILLVEDEPLVSAITEEWLIERGHVVVGPAANLDSALALAATPIDGSAGRAAIRRPSFWPRAAFRSCSPPATARTGSTRPGAAARR